MSVSIVTDDVDETISRQTASSSDEFFYKQLKELEHDFSSSSSSSSSSPSSGTSFSILQSSSSIIVKSNQYYREDRRRHHCRLQACLVQPLLTYMFILLLLANHIQWPIILLSISSMKIVSLHASTTDERPTLRPSTASTFVRTEDEQQRDQCLPMHLSKIEQICSKTCRARQTPFETYDNVQEILAEAFYLPFCSQYLLNQSINLSYVFNETNENECRQIFQNILSYDDEARNASLLFATYMKAIDCASKENRYSIIKSDCQQAYQNWACSVKIPFFHRNQLIPPCQTICDEVERVCPTFRPSDREPLFAGQPLFFCNGGVVANSDYGHRPHCFDTCHLAGGSLQHHSVSYSSLSSNDSFHSMSAVATFAEDLVTTPPCFEIEPFSASSSSPSSFLITDQSLNSSNGSNSSLSTSSALVQSPSSACALITFTFVFFISMIH